MAEEKKNNLNVLYNEVQNIARKTSPDSRVEITPIGGVDPITCFTIFANEESLALVWDKGVEQEVAFLKMTVYKDVDFKYFISQKEDDQFEIIRTDIFKTLREKKVSELNQFSISKTYTKIELLELLRREMLSINERLSQVFTSIGKESTNKIISAFLQKIAKRIGHNADYSFNKLSTTFHFTEEDEKKFHRLFFSKGTHVRQICRYCKLESMYQILSNQTIRLNGLVGMNDKSEYTYAWETFIGNENSLQDIETHMNRTYIMSCSPITSKDDLEMWRLYGDDGKGVCLIFDVENHRDPFMLSQIIYSYTRVGKRKIDEPKWLLLKNLVDELKSIGLPIVFRDQNIWFSFLKSGDYSYEQEIRLLYPESDYKHESKKWVLTDGNSIFNPYVQFDLLPKKKGNGEGVVIPLTLKGIILGPKCQEKEINVKQLTNLLERDPELRKLKIEVSESEITNYR